MKNRSLEYLNSNAKRRLDVLGGLVVASALMPAGLVAALVSEIDTKSLNPIFRQQRVGKDGNIFEVMKFRTLPKALNAEKMQTFGTFDPRASRIGMAIRESGIDEMPQIVNVLRGDMSLVGMRPLLQEDIDRLDGINPKLFRKWHEIYENVKPGLTGPSQIYRHQYKTSTDEVWEEAMRLDLEYSKQASLARDIRILGGTPLKMLNARVHMVDNTCIEAPAPSDASFSPV
jgi:lipopolysaccharide/colanic/teichoic acid biosynthesis glycosyltransferase